LIVVLDPQRRPTGQTSALALVGAILSLLVDKYEPEASIARLLKFLMLFVADLAILHKCYRGQPDSGLPFFESVMQRPASRKKRRLPLQSWPCLILNGDTQSGIELAKAGC